MDAHDAWQIAPWAALHGGGLAVAWASRWSVGTLARCVLHGLLAASLCLVAWLAATHVAHQFQLSLLSATTLVVMVIAAVFDTQGETPDPLLARFAAARD